MKTKEIAPRSDRPAKAVLMYLDEKLPTTEIARRLGCTKQAVLKMLKRAGVERRPCSFRPAPPAPKAGDSYFRSRYIRCRNAGLCVCCAKTPAGTTVLCDPCLERARECRAARLTK